MLCCSNSATCCGESINNKMFIHFEFHSNENDGVTVTGFESFLIFWPLMRHPIGTINEILNYQKCKHAALLLRNYLKNRQTM